MSGTAMYFVHLFVSLLVLLHSHVSGAKKRLAIRFTVENSAGIPRPLGRKPSGFDAKLGNKFAIQRRNNVQEPTVKYSSMVQEAERLGAVEGPADRELKWMAVYWNTSINNDETGFKRVHTCLVDCDNNGCIKFDTALVKQLSTAMSTQGYVLQPSDLDRIRISRLSGNKLRPLKSQEKHKLFHSLRELESEYALLKWTLIGMGAVGLAAIGWMFGAWLCR